MQPPNEQLVDAMLVLRCQSGEVKAMETLVERWQKPLWRHAYRLTGNEDAAWDTVQEAWIGIVRGLMRLEDPECFRRWAYRIVTHKATDWIRRNRQTRHRSRELDANTTPARIDPSPGPAEEAQRLLARVPFDQRTILALRYVDDCSTAEIAEILDIPEGTVKSRLHHARLELKQYLEAMGRDTGEAHSPH